MNKCSRNHGGSMAFDQLRSYKPLDASVKSASTASDQRITNYNCALVIIDNSGHDPLQIAAKRTDSITVYIFMQLFEAGANEPHSLKRVLFIEARFLKQNVVTGIQLKCIQERGLKVMRSIDDATKFHRNLVYIIDAYHVDTFEAIPESEISSSLREELLLRGHLPQNLLMSEKNSMNTAIKPFDETPQETISESELFPTNVSYTSQAIVNTFINDSESDLKASAIKVGNALQGLLRRNRAYFEAVQRQPLSKRREPVSYKEDRQPAFSDPNFTLRCSSVTIPTISITNYLLRFCMNSFSSTCFKAAFIYICRLEANGEITVSPFTIHRLAMVTLLLASKFVEDKRMKNRQFAIWGGINSYELNRLELVCLEKLKWKLYISEAELKCYEKYIDKLSEEYIKYKDLKK